MNIICALTKSFQIGIFEKSIGKVTLWSAGNGRHLVNDTRFLFSSVLCKKDIPNSVKIVKLFHQYCFQTRNSSKWHKKVNFKQLRRCNATNSIQTVGRIVSTENVKLPLQRKTAVQEMKRIIGLAKPERWKLTGQRITRALREKVFGSIVRQEVAFFDQNKTGELINRLSSDTSLVSQCVTMNISDGLRSLIMVCAGVSMMFYMSPQLALVGLTVVPPIAGIAILYGRYVRKITKNVQDALAEATQVAEERIGNIRTVKAFSQEEREVLTYADRMKYVLDLATKESFARGMFYGMEPVLFSGTIRENIAYGAHDPASITDEQIEAVTKEANAYKFITKDFPDGMETRVGERGIMLSGGQKQRIAIARALIKNPKILLLDEATSALDAENEHLVQEALERIMKGRTVLTIAHRLSTIKSADQIAVLDEGHVAQVGNYNELISDQNGIFHKLIKHQTFQASS